MGDWSAQETSQRVKVERLGTELAELSRAVRDATKTLEARWRTEEPEERKDVFPGLSELCEWVELHITRHEQRWELMRALNDADQAIEEALAARRSQCVNELLEAMEVMGIVLPAEVDTVRAYFPKAT